VDQASNVGESFRKASEFTSNVAGSFQDGMKTAKNAVKDGRDAVEDFIDDTARSVKRSPIQSVLLSVAAGLAVGFCSVAERVENRLSSPTAVRK